jgi:ElaB/YqjD/DUF883 family membrane-anchored ribosome-binding protein
MLSTPTKLAAGVTKTLAENDIDSSLKHMGDKAADSIDRAVDNVSEYAHHTGEQIRSAFDTTTDGVKRVTQQVSGEIHKNPVQTTLLALGAGFVIGMMLRK